MHTLGRVGTVSFLMCLVASCGGSGGGSSGGGVPVGPASFAGTYQLSGLRGLFTGGVRNVDTSWGTLVADGVSAAALTLTENDDGTITGPTSLPTTFTVDTAGLISIGSIAGHIGDGGETALLTSVGGSDPLLLALTRAPTSPQSNASLVGLYRFVFFDRGTPEMTGVVMWAIFDGAGVLGLGPGLTNVEGTVDPLSFTVSRPYSVAPDGAVHIALSTLFTLEGRVLEGGELCIAAGGSAAGQPPILAAFVRADPGDESQFAGSYAFAGFEFDPALGMISMGGLAQADGVGAVDREGTTNTNGTAAASPPFSATFTVGPDGTLEILGPLGAKFQGSISSSGRFAVVGGGISAGSNPGIHFYFRR